MKGNEKRRPFPLPWQFTCFALQLARSLAGSRGLARLPLPRCSVLGAWDRWTTWLTPICQPLPQRKEKNAFPAPQPGACPPCQGSVPPIRLKSSAVSRPPPSSLARSARACLVCARALCVRVRACVRVRVRAFSPREASGAEAARHRSPALRSVLRRSLGSPRFPSFPPSLSLSRRQCKVARPTRTPRVAKTHWLAHSPHALTPADVWGFSLPGISKKGISTRGERGKQMR